MKPLFTRVRIWTSISIASAILLSIYSCDGRGAKSSEALRESDKRVGAVSDEPLEAFQDELLELAFETATSIPVHPHIKDRSKAQAAVVTTSLELHQPVRALRYLEKIEDWRRGMSFADLAYYLCRNGNASHAQRYLDVAAAEADKSEDWRRDRIRARIAQTYALLGQRQQARKFEAGVTESESGKVAGVEAMVGDKETFDEQMKSLDALIATENLDLVRNALAACVQLFGRFYDDPQLRSLAEAKIKASWDKLPVLTRIEMLSEMSGIAAGHEDSGKAVELVDEAQTLVESHQWPLEYQLPVLARLAELRFRAGDRERGRADADAAHALFDENGEQIIDIWRAGALRPLAQAYGSMGDTPAALAVFKRAIEEGVRNPNARPRAEDLSATCSAMALCAVEPDEALWARIREIRAGLRDPW